MPSNNDGYETVVGLEVHAQLLTNSKLFSSDSATFGGAPNTHVSAITLAHPGTLPRLNRKAIEFAVKMGLACECEIVKENYFARKNYFYPDLPKGYQLSQHTTPICKDGYIAIQVEGANKNIQLNRIHIEEDAGKSLHDVNDAYTSLDFNRAGVPLIEIVSEPDLRSGDEAYAYLQELRKLVRYLKICDGNMERGSLRCDANISVRKKGDTVLGTKVEIKNLNSIRNVKLAIEHESERMIKILEGGGTITQQTRGFDDEKGTTFAIRDKEDADDYRYFPDPDLTRFSFTNEFIESIRQSIPVLQKERVKKYTSFYLLSEYDAFALTEDISYSDYFEQLIELGAQPKPAANWMSGPVRSWLNTTGNEIEEFPLSPGKLVSLIRVVEKGKVSFSIASGRLFNEVIKAPASDPEELAAQNQWLQNSDADTIANLIDDVLKKFPAKVNEYKKGKTGLLGLFVGEVMKRSGGSADPKLTTELLSKKLNADK